LSPLFKPSKNKMNLEEKIKSTEEELKTLINTFQKNESSLAEIRSQQEQILRRVEFLNGKLEAYKEEKQ